MFRYKNVCYTGGNKIFIKQLQLQIRSISVRYQSTTTIATKNSEVAANKEWENAKPFEEIPSMNTFTLLRNFLPGGKYCKLDYTKLMLAFKEDMGIICKLPGMFGRPGNVFTHNVEDFEKVLRNEGIWPIRPGMEALNYHRSVHRADFFQGIEGVLATQGEQWVTFRRAVNPVLVQPKNVRLYLHKMSQVNKEFIERYEEELNL